MPRLCPVHQGRRQVTAAAILSDLLVRAGDRIDLSADGGRVEAEVLGYTLVAGVQVCRVWGDGEANGDETAVGRGMLADAAGAGREMLARAAACRPAADRG